MYTQQSCLCDREQAAAGLLAGKWYKHSYTDSSVWILVVMQLVKCPFWLCKKWPAMDFWSGIPDKVGLGAVDVAISKSCFQVSFRIRFSNTPGVPHKGWQGSQLRYSAAVGTATTNPLECAAMHDASSLRLSALPIGVHNTDRSHCLRAVQAYVLVLVGAVLRK